jgi:hypothetical protein
LGLVSIGIDISSKEAWEPLKTVGAIDVDLANGLLRRSVAQGSGRSAIILKAIGIQNLNPDAIKAKNEAHHETSEIPILRFQQFPSCPANMG